MRPFVSIVVSRKLKLNCRLELELVFYCMQFFIVVYSPVYQGNNQCFRIFCLSLLLSYATNFHLICNIKSIYSLAVPITNSIHHRIWISHVRRHVGTVVEGQGVNNCGYKSLISLRTHRHMSQRYLVAFFFCRNNRKASRNK